VKKQDVPLFSEEAGGTCLGASAWLLLRSLGLALKAARVHELPHSQPTLSQASPLKILIP